jgi:hypothetical protein
MLICDISPALATDGEYVYLASHQALLKQLANPSGALLRDGRAFHGLPARPLFLPKSLT